MYLRIGMNLNKTRTWNYFQKEFLIKFEQQKGKVLMMFSGTGTTSGMWDYVYTFWNMFFAKKYNSFHPTHKYMNDFVRYNKRVAILFSANDLRNFFYYNVSCSLEKLSIGFSEMLHIIQFSLSHFRFW